MSVTGERQVTGGNGGIFQTEKSRYALDYENALRDSHNRLLVMEGYWLGDKYRVWAVTFYCMWICPQPFPGRTITERYWPGVHRPTLHQESPNQGTGMFKICEK